MRKLSQSNRRVQSRIGSDVIFDGQINFEGELSIAGQVSGQLKAPQGVLSVAHLATVTGEIETQNSSIYGRLEGKVCCHQLCILLSGSTFKGALATPSVEVAAGAMLHGDIQMLTTTQDNQLMKLPPVELRKHLLHAHLLLDETKASDSQKEEGKEPAISKKRKIVSKE